MAVKRGGFGKAGFGVVARTANGLLVEKKDVGLCLGRMGTVVVVWVRFLMMVQPD